MSPYYALLARPGIPASRRLQQLSHKRPGPRIERAEAPTAPQGERTRRGADQPPPVAPSPCRSGAGSRRPSRPRGQASKRAGPPGGGDEVTARPAPPGEGRSSVTAGRVALLEPSPPGGSLLPSTGPKQKPPGATSLLIQHRWLQPGC